MKFTEENMVEKRTSHIHIKIAPSVKAAAQTLASNSGRTLSNYIEHLLLNEIKKGIDTMREIKSLKFDYMSAAHDYAIATADGDVAAAIATEARLTSAETFDVFLDEIRRKHRNEDVDWFDFANEEVEERLTGEEKKDYCEFLTSLTEELKERMAENV